MAIDIMRESVCMLIDIVWALPVLMVGTGREGEVDSVTSGGAELAGEVGSVEDSVDEEEVEVVVVVVVVVGTGWTGTADEEDGSVTSAEVTTGVATELEVGWSAGEMSW